MPIRTYQKFEKDDTVIGGYNFFDMNEFFRYSNVN